MEYSDTCSLNGPHCLSTHKLLAHDLSELVCFTVWCEKKRRWSLVTLFGSSLTYPSVPLLAAQYDHAKVWIQYNIQFVCPLKINSGIMETAQLSVGHDISPSSLFVTTIWRSYFGNTLIMWANVMQLHLISCLGIGIWHFPEYFQTYCLTDIYMM